MDRSRVDEDEVDVDGMDFGIGGSGSFASIDSSGKTRFAISDKLLVIS